ncbi:MAG: NosD domain-containing protein, partial [Vicingaceae bacterium]
MKSLTVLLLFFLLTVSSTEAKNKVIDASDGVKLQSVFDEAAAFDTLWLKGDFEESLLKVEKPLYLFGVEEANISAANGEEILIIASDQVQVKNLTFKNVEASFLKDRAAIRILEVKDILIDSNRFLNTFFGVYVQNSTDCIISHNLFQGEAKDEVHAGNAIHIWKAKRIEVVQNKAYGHRDGIYFEFVDESYIQGNVSINNMRYGLHFMFSNYDIYEDNHFENNGSGVAVMFSKHIKMINNTFKKNW